MKKFFAFSKLYDMIKVKRQARLKARLRRLLLRRVRLLAETNDLTEQIFQTLHQIEDYNE